MKLETKTLISMINYISGIKPTIDIDYNGKEPLN